MKSSYKNYTRRAELEDEKAIKSLLLSAFEDSEGLHLPLEATKKNADNFYAFEIRPAIINGDPIYITYAAPFEAPSTPIAFSCCSTCVNKLYDLKEKLAIGVITVISKPYRNQGIATDLHSRVLARLKKEGVVKVMTEISLKNKPSLNSCLNIINKEELEYLVVANKYECKI